MLYKWYNAIVKILDNEGREEKKKRATEMTLEAQEARRVYKQEYRRRNREKINQKQREWRAANPEKVKLIRCGIGKRKQKIRLVLVVMEK